MKFTYAALILSILIFTVISCEKEPEVINEDLYIDLVTELSVLNQMNEELLGEMTKAEKREEIFAHYNVSESEFNDAHEYYQSDIDAQMSRVKIIQDRLRTERDSVQAAERRHRDENRINPDSIRQQIRNRNLNTEN